MSKTFLFNFEVDRSKKQIMVERSFNAPVSLVWSAWTEAEILDQWWAPNPWKARTKTMDFREGGHWLYAMVGPENEEHWARVDFVTIRHRKYFTANDFFCDADGNPDPSLPESKWENGFTDKDRQTVVNIVLTFNTLEDLEKIIEMGFKEGFTSGLENLDRYLEVNH